MSRVGLMLYTLRDECERDLEGTLRTVAALGCEGVELWQLHGHDAAQVRAWLDEFGLVAVGRHAELDTIRNELPRLASELAALGTDRIVLSYVVPEWRALVRIALVAMRARRAGLRLGVHNHGAELRPYVLGRTFLDLLRWLPPKLLWFELDLGWIWHAGADPVRELARTRGRCPLVHLKDFRSRQGRDDVPLGEGAVGYESVVPAALSAGVEWLLVEQDQVEGPPFEAVERSLQALTRMLAGAR